METYRYIRTRQGGSTLPCMPHAGTQPDKPGHINEKWFIFYATGINNVALTDKPEKLNHFFQK